MATLPISNTVYCHFRARRHSHPKLNGEEHRAGIIAHKLHEAFPCQPPQHLANGDRADTTLRLRDGHQVGPGNKGGSSAVGAPRSQQGDNASKLFQEAVTATRPARLSKVLDSES